MRVRIVDFAARARFFEEGFAMSKTMFEKIWEAHIVRQAAGQPALLYIDLQSGSRGHVPAGVRGAAIERTQRPSSRSYGRDDGSQCADN